MASAGRRPTRGYRHPAQREEEAMKRRTPPLFLRRLAPWQLLAFINLHTDTCWSGMVMWKLGYEGWSWWPAASCWAGPQGGWDYCHKYEAKDAFLDALEGKR